MGEPAKVYYDGCPGCAMDRRKESREGVPYKELLFVGTTTFASALPITSLFPFLYFMIRDLHVAQREEDIGFYAGFLGASYMIGRGLASVFWGIIADRIGRKPVIAFSVFSVIVFNTLFGLSVKYWMAIATRFLLGALNGFLAPVKAYSIEVCRPEQQALGISIVSTAWGMGVIIGPAIGGYLAQPVKQYPHLFHEKSVFGRFPYLLPCLFISFFATLVFISCAWLPETLHKHKGLERTVEMVEGPTAQESTEPPKKSLLKNWPLMSSIITYCVFSLHDTAYVEIFSLWTVSNRKYGGLSFSSKDVGQVLTVAGTVYTNNCCLSLHDTPIRNKTWCAALHCSNAEKCICNNQSYWHFSAAKQCCATRTKGRCKWNSYNCNVFVEGFCSSWSRHYILMGTEAPTCRVLSRRPDGVSATESDRADRADTELQAFPGSSPAVQMKHIARVGVAR
ncbi:protein ZINC INDUCED FACILITATOR-LIKE 1-like isoform X2 [Panicum hallii]|uniref:protein ZINC INDUCED FACILITATOR-LIKE 1-like isoform X2 n=1 Tax=Panicum hallii TaxID=206008 RepID=UPI000DF4E46B|nr:protein ZINC INDUCED FACILITATOR-LIKE 1-like isoform X2 [Panicum hallii]